MNSRFEITEKDLPKEKRSERVTIEMSMYDLEIVLRSLDESYLSELYKTKWEQQNPGEYPPQYYYSGNNITRKIKSTIKYLKSQINK